MRKTMTLVASTIFTLSLTGAALAKGGTPQNHHCMKDGAEQAGKTHKQCTKDGGKWEKMAGAPADKAAPPPAKAEPAPAK